MRVNSGFTIVELLVVIVVIAILAAITVVSYNGIANRAKAVAAQAEATQAAEKVIIYAATNGDSYPDNLTDAGVRTDSSDTTFQYSVNNALNPRVFCVTATVQSISYYYSATNSRSESGNCPGHVASLTCPLGYIRVPGNATYSTSDFCVMKYEAKNDGSGNAVSTATGSPTWASVSQATATSKANAACSGCHLITENEWLTIAANVISVPSNWSGGDVGSGYIYSGHNDSSPSSSLVASANDSDGYSGTGQSAPSNQLRTLTLTNGEVIWDFAGNVAEWTNGTIAGGQLPGLSGDPGFSFKEYTNGSLLWNGFPNQARPANVYPGAGSWGSSKGLGQLYTYYSYPSASGFIRGGNFCTSTNAGVLGVFLNGTPSCSGSGFGFRVAK